MWQDSTGATCVKGVSPGLLFAIDHDKQNIWGMGRDTEETPAQKTTIQTSSNWISHSQNMEKSHWLKSIELLLLTMDRHVAPVSLLNKEWVQMVVKANEAVWELSKKLGYEIILQPEQKLAVLHLVERRDVLAILLTRIGERLISQLFLLIVKIRYNENSNYVPVVLLIFPLLNIIKDIRSSCRISVTAPWIILTEGDKARKSWTNVHVFYISQCSLFRTTLHQSWKPALVLVQF